MHNRIKVLSCVSQTVARWKAVEVTILLFHEDENGCMLCWDQCSWCPHCGRQHPGEPGERAYRGRLAQLLTTQALPARGNMCFSLCIRHKSWSSHLRSLCLRCGLVRMLAALCAGVCASEITGNHKLLFWYRWWETSQQLVPVGSQVLGTLSSVTDTWLETFPCAAHKNNNLHGTHVHKAFISVVKLLQYLRLSVHCLTTEYSLLVTYTKAVWEWDREGCFFRKMTVSMNCE